MLLQITGTVEFEVEKIHGMHAIQYLMAASKIVTYAHNGRTRSSVTALALVLNEEHKFSHCRLQRPHLGCNMMNTVRNPTIFLRHVMRR